MRDIELFAALDPDALASLSGQVERVSLPGGEVLMAQGEPADCAYVVCNGRLRVSVAGPDGVPRPVNEVGRGEMVGEMALLTNDPRSATVTAIRDTELLRLPGDALATLFAQPDALRQVVTQLVDRIGQAIRATTPRTPIATLAIVPLHPGPAVEATIAAITAALRERTSSLAEVWAEQDPPVDCNRLEADHAFVVFGADPDPTPWTDRCLRHADQILLVAGASEDRARRPVEDLVDDRRRAVGARSEFVLVHPAGGSTPRGTSGWLAPRSVDAHHHVRTRRAEDAARVARHLLDRPVVLVLSGGGARGLAQVGAVRALEEQGVPIDAVAGTSAGALVGAVVAQGWDHRRVEDELRRGLAGLRPLDPTFPAVALTAGRRVTERLQTGAGRLDLEDCWLPFFCVSTNLSRNEAHVHRRGPTWRAVRASFAIPGVFPPLADGDDVLVDGGLVDNLPVERARAEHDGATVISVDVGMRRDLPAGALPDDGIVSGWPVLWDVVHPRRRRADMVSIIRVLTRLTDLGKAPGADRGDLVVRPDVTDIPMLDFDRFDELVERGHQAAEAALESWLADRAGAPF